MLPGARNRRAATVAYGIAPLLRREQLVVVQWLRDNSEKLKKQDAQLKASNDIFSRERQHLSIDNEILAKTVGGLQQRVSDMQADIQSAKQQVYHIIHDCLIGLGASTIPFCFITRTRTYRSD